MTEPSNHTGLRVALLALAIGAPALACAAGVTVVEIWHVIRPMWSEPAMPPPPPLSEVISRNEQRELSERLMAGHDPNAPLFVAPPAVAVASTVSPLMWALAQRRDGIAFMLIAFGARVEASEQHAALCAARERGNEVLEQLLARSSRLEDAAPCTPASLRSFP